MADQPVAGWKWLCKSLFSKIARVYWVGHGIGIRAKLAQAGVTCVHPIREQPWGQRVFRVFDPDRHLVDIGEPMPVVVRRFIAQGQTVEQIAARTFMPVELVRTMAG